FTFRAESVPAKRKQAGISRPRKDAWRPGQGESMSPKFISRAATFAGAVLLVIVVGCVSAPWRKGAPLEQKGEARLAIGAEQTVKFPMPFASAPEIETQDSWLHEFKIVEKTPTEFRIRNTADQVIWVNWTARGERPATSE